MDAQDATNTTEFLAAWRNGHKRALEATLGGVSVTEAAEAAGKDRTTLYRWMRDDPAFAEAFEQARIYGRRRRFYSAEDYLFEAASVARGIDKPGVQAAERIVKSLARDVYGDRQTTDGSLSLSIPDGPDLSLLSDEDRREYIRLQEKLAGA